MLLRTFGAQSITKIETGFTAIGVPDVNFFFPASALFRESCEGWLELEVAHIPVRRTTKVDVPHLYGAQIVWLRRRCYAGLLAGALIEFQHAKTKTTAGYLLVAGRYLPRPGMRLTFSEWKSLGVWWDQRLPGPHHLERAIRGMRRGSIPLGA